MRTDRDIVICTAYEAGASLRQIAERFGLTAEGVRKVLLRNGRTARSRSEGWRARLRADPAFAQRQSERSSERMKALHDDPEFARRNSEAARERMKARHADPEFARRHSERMKARHADPARNPLVTLTPKQRAVYDLLRSKGYTREEALVEARRLSREVKRNVSVSL